MDELKGIVREAISALDELQGRLWKVADNPETHFEIKDRLYSAIGTVESVVSKLSDAVRSEGEPASFEVKIAEARARVNTVLSDKIEN